MCLIALAHRASQSWPLVIAANRDEFFARPTRAAHWWDDAPDVFGGRDLQAGGSWMAMTRGGRFAMVTNVRGVGQAEAGPHVPSRGTLVGEFVRGADGPFEFAQQVERDRYQGFHLVCGEAGRVVAHVSSDAAARVIEPGIFAVSNAPAAVDWPKIAYAREAMERALASDHIKEELMRFLTTPRGGAIENEVFVSLPERRYGTRSSTVVLVDADGVIDFTERSAAGEARFRSPSRS
jgi:uncharacterized protein with NRDE domain